MLTAQEKDTISSNIWSEFLLQNFGIGVAIVVGQGLFLLAGLYLVGIHTPLAIFIPTAMMLLFGLAYLLFERGHPNLAVLICQMTPMLLITPVTFSLPWVRLESLFFLPLAIGVLIHVESRKWAVRLFLLHFSGIVIFQVYESFVQVLPELNPAQHLANQLLLFTALVFICSAILVTFFAIVKQKQKWIDREQMLITSQKRYLALFENSFDAILIYDHQKRLATRYNAAFRKMFNYTGEEGPINLDLVRITPKLQRDDRRTREVVEVHMKTLEMDPTPIRFEFLHQRINGPTFETETTLIPHPYNRGETIAIMKDLSAQKRAEEALNRSQARYKNIVESSPSGISIFKPDGAYLYASPRSLEIFGGPRPEESTDINIFDYLPETEHDKLRRYLENASQSSSTQTESFRIRRRDGQEIVIRAFTKGMKIAGEHGEELIIIFNDVTEEVLAEQKLAAREAMLNAIINSSPNSICAINDQLEVIVANDISKNRYRRKYGLDQVLGTPIRKVLSSDAYEVFERRIRRVLSGESLIEHTYEQVAPGGKLMYLDISYAPAVNNDGAIFAAVITARDITELKERELSLSKKNVELRRYINSNMELENFAYIASHDLQAPLRTIVSFTQLLQKNLDGSVTPLQQEYMEFIISGTKNMSELIQALLTFSRANTTKRDLADIDVRELLDEVASDLQSTLQDKQAVLKMGVLPAMIRADKMKLKQVFQNLFTNALKFQVPNEPPRIQVSGEDLEKEWRFTVRDNGIGINPEFQDKIFLLFKRLHNQTQYEGTGIGLALCKKLIEQHDGEIGVSSKPGEGSRFHFTISKQLA